MRRRFLISLFYTVILVAINIFPIHTVLGFGDVLPQTGVTPISPVIVSTPNPDGSIIHTVRYGQTLVMIAEGYGIPISEIQRLNGMPEGISDIFEGQRLIIRVALPPTETPTLTPTKQPPTRTPRNTTPIMTPTPLPSPTTTPISLIPRGISINRKAVGIVFVSIGMIGLIAIGIQQLLSKRHNKTDPS
ncbi:MAG: LysM peptidoglycan-binding domain-containing protein [Anaerolineaceae bacterium]